MAWLDVVVMTGNLFTHFDIVIYIYTYDIFIIYRDKMRNIFKNPGDDKLYIQPFIS